MTSIESVRKVQHSETWWHTSNNIRRSLGWTCGGKGNVRSTTYRPTRYIVGSLEDSKGFYCFKFQFNYLEVLHTPYSIKLGGHIRIFDKAKIWNAVQIIDIRAERVGNTRFLRLLLALVCAGSLGLATFLFFLGPVFSFKNGSYFLGRIIVDGHIFSGAYTLYFAVYLSLLGLLPVLWEHRPQYDLLWQFARMTRRPLEENVRNGNC